MLKSTEKSEKHQKLAFLTKNYEKKIKIRKIVCFNVKIS